MNFRHKNEQQREKRVTLSILKALEELQEAGGATRLRERLAAEGTDISARTIRHYLLQLDRRGLTRLVSRRRGRTITSAGRRELSRADIVSRLGFVGPRVDDLGYRMTFNLRKREGTLVTNLALLAETDLEPARRAALEIFAAGYSMGQWMLPAYPGDIVCGRPIPDGHAGLGTVCSVTVNGLLLQHGIPVSSRFGGLVEIRSGEPERFVELMEYSGTTVDPLEVFIRAGMTSTLAAANTGNGVIGASFREIPAAALRDAIRIQRRMEAAGLGGILALGKPNTPLLDVPVADGRAAMVVIGGLNPVAAVHEIGIEVHLESLSGLTPAGLFQST